MDDVHYDDNRERFMRALGHVVVQMGMLEVSVTRDLAIMMSGSDDIVLRVIAGEGFGWQLDKMRALAEARPDDEQRREFPLNDQ